MDIIDNPRGLATSATGSPTQNSDSELLPLPSLRDKSIVSSGGSVTEDDGYTWDPENPENQQGLFENGGMWGPGWADRLAALRVCCENSYFRKQANNERYSKTPSTVTTTRLATLRNAHEVPPRLNPNVRMKMNQVLRRRRPGIE